MTKPSRFYRVNHLTGASVGTSIFTMSRNEPNPTGSAAEDAKDVRSMQLVRAGDTVAFEELVERHHRLVAGTVARMLGSNSEVEDIAQQVFVRVWKSAKRYVPRAKFTTWLLKITRNLVFNELRRRSRHAHLPLEWEEERPKKMARHSTGCGCPSRVTMRDRSRLPVAKHEWRWCAATRA